MNVCIMNEIQMYNIHHVFTVMWPTASIVSLHWNSQILSSGLMG